METGALQVPRIKKKERKKTLLVPRVSGNKGCDLVVHALSEPSTQEAHAGGGRHSDYSP